MADSLREALAAAMDNAEPIETAAEPIETAAPEATEAPEAHATETATEKADRLRDEAGRFAPNAKSATSTKAPVVDPLAPVVEPIKPPSSWKKDHWETFGKLSPEIQKYINERESQFASGVSTYKQEAERAKEIWTALQPYSEDLQRYNVTPAQWINQVGSVHQALVKGDMPTKLQTASQLLQNYNVPARLVTQDAQGQWQFVDARQLQQAQQQATPQSQFKPEDIAKIVEDKLLERTLATEIQQFQQSHPHYEAVRSQMSGLLQTGMAENLNDAYEKAILLNPELREAEQQRIAQENAEKARQEAAARVAKARASAVSPRSDTPSGSMAGDGKKGLRAHLEDAVESVSSGRV